VEEPKLNRYYIAHIRMRGEDGFRTVQAAENRNGMGAIHPWILARDTKSVLMITGDNLIESDAGYKGLLIRGGIVFQYSSAFGCMAMYPDMTMRLFEKKTVGVDDLLEDGVRDVFSFGPVLVQDGVVNEASGEHRLSRRDNPRTGIGMVEPGHFVAIVVDGRQPDYSVGMFLPEFAELFIEEGCTVAYNLDGGVSACMVFMGEQLNRHGNKRVGTYQDSYQRRVPDGLVWGYSDQVPSADEPVYNTGTSETATP
jgi:exopolysaccharide biosynthesis protein